MWNWSIPYDIIRDVLGKGWPKVKMKVSLVTLLWEDARILLPVRMCEGTMWVWEQSGIRRERRRSKGREYFI